MKINTNLKLQNGLYAISDEFRNLQTQISLVEIGTNSNIRELKKRVSALEKKVYTKKKKRRVYIKKIEW